MPLTRSDARSRCDSWASCVEWRGRWARICCFVSKSTVVCAPRGLCSQVLYKVTQAVLVAQLLYASRAWSGFLKPDEISKLQMVLNKPVHYRFLPLSCRTMNSLSLLIIPCFRPFYIIRTMSFISSSPSQCNWTWCT